MINAEIFTAKDGELLGFSIKGHSGFAEFGSDIVCAAVSSAAYMTANTITDVLNVHADIVVNDGYMYLRVSPQNCKECRHILSGFKLHLCSLTEQYPDYLIVNYLEV